ncbi:TonB-dependent receptor [Chitinophaga caseinilytica]|uniref:TonB-dependent receptor n=1 Tax=Chitinophaga caseinilytica TaxID=2267521 RepID=A0ABZ2Z5X2_9BACT
MNTRLLLIPLMAVCVTNAYAQTQQATGRVTDARDGTPLPGVTVRIKGSTTGTITDANGSFKLNAPSGAVLICSFTGYYNKEAIVGAGPLHVALSADQKSLDEVVVVGYGTQDRRDVTGSVGTVKGDNLKTIAAPSFEKAMAGSITGVQVNTTSGILGEPARIRIRGVNSISSSSDPLYVVDGVPYISGDQSGSQSVPYNPLGDINPADIESVEVLKDGSATAIYGSRASAGVVLITTKKGKLGKPRLSYDGWIGMAQASKKFDLMNAAEFMEVTNEKLTNAGAAAAAKQPADKYYDTDWQDLVLRNAVQHSHALSLSGATESTNYYFSLGYSDFEGIAVANDQKKYNVRARVEQKAFDRLKIGINMAATHTTDNGLNYGTNALSGNIAGAIRALPNVPAKWEDGSYNLSADKQRLGRAGNGREIDDNYTNILFVLENNIYKNQSLNLTGNTFAELEIIPGLTAKTQVGINYLNGEYYRYWSPVHGDGRGVNGSTAQYNLPQFRYNWQNTLNFNRTFGDHKVGAIAGLEWQKTRSRYFYASGTNISSEFFGGQNIITDAWGARSLGGYVAEKAFQSVFGRANYGYKDRYLIAATLRYDKISDLPWGNQGATLPGVSVGWRVSEEAFFKRSNSLNFISNLKLRGGFAKVGNVELGSDYPYAGTFSPYLYGEIMAMAYSQISNNNLRFETANKINIGLDAGLFENRVNFTAEYFSNNVDNMILAAPLAPSLGVPYNNIKMNIGEMTNKGWEFSVNAEAIATRDFRWNTAVNLTLTKNKVTQLYNGADIIGTYHIIREGQPVGMFYGFEYAGVNPANGNPLWVKADGSIVQGVISRQGYAKYDPAKPDDVSVSAPALNTNDKKILGNSNPTWFGGFSNTLSYKRFDLGINLVFSGGNKVFSATRQETLANMKFQNAGRELLDRWTTPGQVTDVPKLMYGSNPGNFINQNGNTNSRFLEDGSYLRAQNITLGFNAPSAWLNRFKVNSLRVYAQVQNAFVITNYSGLDPELTIVGTNNAARNWQAGLDYNSNPLPRTYTLGVNLGL